MIPARQDFAPTLHMAAPVLGPEYSPDGSLGLILVNVEDILVAVDLVTRLDSEVSAAIPGD